jgi:membrane associated rhomboid family serine protease
MKMQNLRWRLQSNVVSRQLISAIFVSTIAFALGLRSVVLTDAGTRSINLAAVFAVYIAIVVAILFRYAINGGKDQSVNVTNGIISIPRLIFANYAIKISEIKSVEKFARSQSVYMVVIGRLSKSSITVERRIFDAQADFDQFLHFVDNVALPTEAGIVNNDINVVAKRRSDNNSALAVVLTVAILIAYVLTTYPGIEIVNDKAVAQGGLTKDILHGSEWYRVASSFFLHYNPFHLGLNLVSFGIMMQYMVVIVGKVRSVNVLFGAAVCGALLSVYFSPYEAVIGASGGLLGLFGAYLIIVVKYRDSLPGSVSVSAKAMSLALGVQVFCDLTMEGIDIFSHLGGFLFGCAYAIVFLYRRSCASAATSCAIERWFAIGIATAFSCGLTYFVMLYLS